MSTFLKHFIFFLLSNSFFLVSASGNEENACRVFLQNGTVIGSLTKTLNPEKNVCAFTGIPYAIPPTASLRFQAPQPISQPWGILNATRLPNWCPQVGTPPSGVEISEDCLYLNVFVPFHQTNDRFANLSVMIWFHGGSFIDGSSLPFTPKRLLARGDVILVTVHYRLGLLGFLSTGDSVVPGNNGLKDQSLSIHWVHEEIEKFGGNPNQITIFGESSGGQSVIFQLITPLNKGLIHGAIAQSGTALYFFDRNPLESAKFMAQRLHCLWEHSSTLEMVTCLKLLPWQEIINAQFNLTIERYQQLSRAYETMAPVIEPKDSHGAFITEEPEDLLKSGDIPDIPMILGANRDEGSYMLALLHLFKFGPEELDKDAGYMRKEIVPDIIKYLGNEENMPGNRMVASAVEMAFLDGVNRSSWEESRQGLVDILGVFMFKSGIQNTADILSGRGRKVYLYSFEHLSNNSLLWSSLGFDQLSPPMPVKPGVGHGDDLLYLFEYPTKFSDEDVNFTEVMCDMWLNFARYGNPTPLPDTRFDNWAPYDEQNEPFLNLTGSPQMQYGYRTSWRHNEY